VLQQETATPQSPEKVQPALLAPRREDGPRITFAVSRQYSAVPLVFASPGLLAFLLLGPIADWIGAAGVALCLAWSLGRLAWVERLTLNRHSRRYRYRRGWWPFAPLKVGVLAEIQSVTLDRQELSGFAVPVSLTDLVWRYARIWKSCVWIVGLEFATDAATLAVVNFFDHRTEAAARAYATELAKKLGLPLIDRAGSA